MVRWIDGTATFSHRSQPKRKKDEYPACVVLCCVVLRCAVVGSVPQQLFGRHARMRTATAPRIRNERTTNDKKRSMGGVDAMPAATKQDAGRVVAVFLEGEEGPLLSHAKTDLQSGARKARQRKQRTATAAVLALPVGGRRNEPIGSAVHMHIHPSIDR
mmetsp:Transcript_17304/g.39513  ORF Transcript_17304/g.39513 Transcript_17304/m.39513 type:complete len:159 (-) Transcript_17304:271-747(-)